MTSFVVASDFESTGTPLASRAVSPRSTQHLCPECETVLYVASTRFPTTIVLRSGTVDQAEHVSPGAHIWVKRKQAWLALPTDVPHFEEQYDREAVWPAESLARYAAL